MSTESNAMFDLAGRLAEFVTPIRIRSSRQTWEHIRIGQGIYDNPLKIGGKEYPEGIGGHANNSTILEFAAPVTHFHAVVGIEENQYTVKSFKIIHPLRFLLLSGDEILAASPEIGFGKVFTFEVDFAPTTTLEIRTESEGSIFNAFFDWCDVEATTADGVSFRFMKGTKGLQASLPISFNYDGRSSGVWFMQRHLQHAEKAFEDKTVHTYSSDLDGMEMTVNLTAWKNHPVWEWHTTFTNRTDRPSGQLRNVKSSDVVFGSNALQVYLKRIRGSFVNPALESQLPLGFKDSYLPVDNELAYNVPVESRCLGGRATQEWLPLMDVVMGEETLRSVVGWSGQWQATAEWLLGAVQLTAGMEDLDLYLEPGESIDLPAGYLLHSTTGGDERCVNLWRRFVMEALTPRVNGKFQRPPLTSSYWGGMTCQQHLERVKLLEDNRIPSDVYWIDAGWFAPPSIDEFSSVWSNNVGDWDIDKESYPDEMVPIAEAVHRTGRQFLLWFEPERVRTDRNIAREHPEYLLYNDTVDALLNLGNPEAWQWAFDKIAGIISRNHIDWFRVDFNFNPLEYWRRADGKGRRGITELRYMAGLYKFWTAMRERFPGLQIDNCASGGRRLDPQLLKMSYPLWYSDMMCFENFNADYSLTHINGMARYWPVFGGAFKDIMGADNYNFRACMNACLNYGWLYSTKYDMNPDKYPLDWFRTRLHEFLDVQDFFMRDFYPLLEPVSTKQVMWACFQYDRPEKHDGMILVFRSAQSVVIEASVIPRALEENRTYRVWDLDKTFEPLEISGRDLLDKGITLRLPRPQSALVIRYEAVQG